VASPDLPDSRSFDLTTDGGDAYLTFTLNKLGVTCTCGWWHRGLYLDGKPLPGTEYDVPAYAAASSISFASAIHPTAGKHTASIGVGCPIGTFSGVVQTDPHGAVVSTG
jgi:hypothetical protein